LADVVKIEGLAKLRRELKAVQKDLPKELTKVSEDAAEIVAEQSRLIVPVRTGRLRGSIKSAAIAKGGQVRTVGVPYAKVIHFGWAKHHIRPNPFIYDALDDRRDEVVAKFEQGLAALMEKNFTPGVGE